MPLLARLTLVFRTDTLQLERVAGCVGSRALDLHGVQCGAQHSAQLMLQALEQAAPALQPHMALVHSVVQVALFVFCFDDQLPSPFLMTLTSSSACSRTSLCGTLY